MKSFKAFQEAVADKKQAAAIAQAKLDRKSALKVKSVKYRKENSEIGDPNSSAPEANMSEAKVDAGKSPETKEKDRNVRKFGVSHNVSGHGKLRRSLHRMNRGDKKIPGDKSKWMEMEGKDYGITRGDGKPKGVMKAYLDAKAKKLSKEKAAQKPEYRNNPAFGDPSHHSNRKNIKEFVGTTLAGTAGAATAKKGDKIRKAIGSGAGYAVGAKAGRVAGGEIGKAVGKATVPVVGGMVGKTVGKAIGGTAGAVAGAVTGNKLAGTSKKKVKEEVELDENIGPAINQGLKQGGKWAVRQGIKVGGKKGGYAVKAAGKYAATAAKETAVEYGKGALKGAKDRAGKAGERHAKNLSLPQKQQTNEGLATAGGLTYKKSEKPGKFEKAGRVVGGIGGSVAGSIGGSAAAGAAGSVVPGAGTVAGGIAGGIAGSVAGDIAGTRTGGSIGQKIDKITGGNKKPVAKKTTAVTKESKDIADILARLEKKRISKGGDAKDSPLPAFRKYHADKDKKKKEVKEQAAPDKMDQKLRSRDFNRSVSKGISGAIKMGMNRHKDAVEKKKVADRKAVPYQAMAASYTPQGDVIGEEGYDRMRDDKLVKYGIGHGDSNRKGSTRYHSRPDTPEQKKRKQAASDQAFKNVVASLKKRYGDGVMTSSKKIRKGKEVK